MCQVVDDNSDRHLPLRLPAASSPLSPSSPESYHTSPAKSPIEELARLRQGQTARIAHYADTDASPPEVRAVAHICHASPHSKAEGSPASSPLQCRKNKTTRYLSEVQPNHV